MALSPEANYHLCPDFHIPPPVDGQLDLGTILLSLDPQGVAYPLNFGTVLPAPRELIIPKLSEKDYRNWREGGGVTRTLGQVRSVEGSLWGRIATGIGGKLSWLRERSNDDTIKVDKILMRYFIPTDEYMTKALSAPNIKPRTDRRGKKLPLYMITGLMIAVGFSLSKIRSKKVNISAKGEGAEPTTGSGGGAGGGYKSEDTTHAEISSSSNIVLGFRVRKIYWEHNEQKISDDVAGATLEQSAKTQEPSLFDGLKVVDDFTTDPGSGEQIFINTDENDGIGFSSWVLP
ncbi:hypothetical protein GQ53DRAFT_851441 [Thozetella sp. PMI_491]|nr:hypothetical protein GQ53DRAFT_851441 [Thozetella sp. PMI_491]